MLYIKKFIFNPFAVNTYVLFDDSGECAIIDPACYDKHEESQLMQFIAKKALKPVRLLNTHGHLDHMFGNAFICNNYHLQPELHQADQFLADSAPDFARNFSLSYTPAPPFSHYLQENEDVTFGNTSFYIMLVPGHSPGSIVLVNEANSLIISGDVLFAGSIGRTDLPQGNYNILINGIKNKLLHLPTHYRIFPGHGNETTIGHEKKHNVFLQQ